MGVICSRTQGTKLVVKDGTLDICSELLKDKAYADAVDIVGLHYPSDFGDFSVTWQLILPPPVLSPPQRAVKNRENVAPALLFVKFQA